MGFRTIQDCTCSSITPCSCPSCRGPIGSSPPWEWLYGNVLLLSYKHGITTHELSQEKRAENRARFVPEMYLTFPPTALNVELLVLDIRHVSNHGCLVLSDAQHLVRLSVCVIQREERRAELQTVTHSVFSHCCCNSSGNLRRW